MEYINLFWDKQKLKKLNYLCLLSLLNFNNKIIVYTYEPSLFNDFKHENLSIVNANEIIDEKEKFYYKGNNNCGYNCVVGFSDLFRYLTLYKHGGWYFDFDVIMFSEFPQELKEMSTIIRPHFGYTYASNISKFQKNDPILLQLYDETRKQVNENNNDWGLPLRIFTDIIQSSSYKNNVIDKKYFSDDNFTDIVDLLFTKTTNLRDFKNFVGFHVCHTYLSSGLWKPEVLYNFNDPPPLTKMHYLYKKYKLL